ncbi:hypothetical protein AB4571_02275 [Vibrio breoganii]|uniref:hypothetical protein n=1 Tax=Vibrio breoganii TaxID=553239 RepID=UPI000C84A879|nr:hypothetical protein [Vibrio breoganii]PML12740.1 hypothetical protein BCT84_02325 [Vibrio breoganii]
MNFKLTKTAVLAIACSAVLSGCASQVSEYEKVMILESSIWLDKPAHLELVELASVNPSVLEVDKDEVLPQETLVEPNVVHEEHPSEALSGEQQFKHFNAQLKEGKHASYIAESATYIMAVDETYDFAIYETETYAEALHRWLGDHGYLTVGQLLDLKQVSVLRGRADATYQITSSLPDAIDSLIDKAKGQLVVHRKGELSQGDVESLHFSVELDAESQTAIVTSSKLPVTMFHVEPGSLIENFERLGEHYGWKASEDMYLARQYQVPFGYPVVTEQGNVKRALEQMLSGFSTLRGAVVPSVREIYVLEEVR